MVFYGVLNDLKWNFMENSNCYINRFIFIFFPEESKSFEFGRTLK